MGPVYYSICTVISVLLLLLAIIPFQLINCADHRGQIFMGRSPEPIAVPIGDEVTLECEMNIKPDAFRWRHFPIRTPYTNAPIQIDQVHAADVPQTQYTSVGNHTTVTINVNSTKAAGDYQCLAMYGASVLASVPGRVTIAEIGTFPFAQSSQQIVSAGNTVAIRCELPPSNPPAAVQYYKSNVPLSQSLVLPTGTLLLQNVSNYDSGTYTCSANNYITGETRASEQKTFLTVTRNTKVEKPRFLSPPNSNYTVTTGETVFLECSAVGNPPPKVVWYKLDGKINSERFEFVPGGVQIKNVTISDQGTYVCEHDELKYRVTLILYERPAVTFTSLTEIKEGENLDFECTVNGTPEPVISWLINGNSVLNDSSVEVIGNKIYFAPVEKRHAGILQCLATNQIGSDYGYTFLNIYPKQISTSLITPSENKKHPNSRNDKNSKSKSRSKSRSKGQAVMIPPSKPNVTRLSDESVMVRWSVSENIGLPILFFKVQYRELGLASQQNGNHGRSKASRWKTTNADIIPHLRSYQVDNLKPDHIYRFRIAAVYSNSDNMVGSISAKFHLKREDFFVRNPLPVPMLTATEGLTSESIKIHWEYTPNPNVTIDGFYVNYQLTSSAGDYFKATVDGEQSRSYVIGYLLPDTMYDIKLQSYTTSGVSDFSAVLKQKTLPLEQTTTVPDVITLQPNRDESSDSLPIVMIISFVVIILVIAIVIVLIIYILKKRHKNVDRSQDSSDDKRAGVTEDRGHHIQMDGNGYLGKTLPRGLSNGCAAPTNRITITANPLADADDNQNQNMIEMSCLTSQNNNCATGIEPVSTNNELPTQQHRQILTSKHKNKNVDGLKSSKLNTTETTTAATPAENYV